MGSEAQREFMFNLGKITNIAAEIGSYKGLSAAIVLSGMMATERTDLPKYYCIDTFQSSNEELDGKDTLDEFKKNLGVIDTLGIVVPVVGYSYNVVLDIPNELDWVYIDGSHDTDSVLRDILMYAPKVKRGGYLLFHDYTWDSVKKAIDQEAKVGFIKHVCSFDDFAVHSV
jgi:predicted O-methyltransferase YrrM